MANIEEWQASIAENERRAALRQQIEREGPAFVRRCLADSAQTTARRLEEFVSGREFAFIRQTLSKLPYDKQQLNRSYSRSVPESSISSQGVIEWPPSVLVLQSGAFVGSGPRTFHAVTGEGLTEFKHGYSLWSGAILRSAPISARQFVQFRIEHFAPHGPMAVASGRGHLFSECVPRITWKEWTRLARQDVESFLSTEAIEAQIVRLFSRMVSVRP